MSGDPMGQLASLVSRLTDDECALVSKAIDEATAAARQETAQRCAEAIRASIGTMVVDREGITGTAITPREELVFRTAIDQCVRIVREVGAALARETGEQTDG